MLFEKDENCAAYCEDVWFYFSKRSMSSLLQYLSQDFDLHLFCICCKNAFRFGCLDAVVLLSNKPQISTEGNV